MSTQPSNTRHAELIAVDRPRRKVPAVADANGMLFLGPRYRMACAIFFKFGRAASAASLQTRRKGRGKRVEGRVGNQSFSPSAAEELNIFRWRNFCISMVGLAKPSGAQGGSPLGERTIRGEACSFWQIAQYDTQRCGSAVGQLPRQALPARCCLVNCSNFGSSI